MSDFAALGLSAPLLRALEKRNFTTPTDIQAAAIPPLLEGHDLVGLAETGAGKTAAFLLPMLERLAAGDIHLEPGAPRALILAPTRELAQQLSEAVNALSGQLPLRSVVVYGGAPMHKQLSRLKAGVDILIATPGRLMDHVERGSVRFDAAEIFILDEADRMLDMGFVNDVKTISRALPDPHQTVMFSATINKSVEGLTKVLLNEPVRVGLAPQLGVSEQITHCVMHLQQPDKRTLLMQTLKARGDGQVIIFTKTKHGADRLSRDLVKKGMKSDAIHGDRNQRQRQRTLSRFRSGAIDILVATDVAARGIDVPGIACVINYDLPLEADSYVHRVGRTGRNGASGLAVSFCTPEEVGLLRDIERFIKQTITIDADHDFHLDPPADAPRPQRGGRGGGRGRGRAGGPGAQGGERSRGRARQQGPGRNDRNNFNDRNDRQARPHVAHGEGHAGSEASPRRQDRDDRQTHAEGTRRKAEHRKGSDWKAGHRKGGYRDGGPEEPRAKRKHRKGGKPPFGAGGEGRSVSADAPANDHGGNDRYENDRYEREGRRAGERHNQPYRQDRRGQDQRRDDTNSDRKPRYGKHSETKHNRGKWGHAGGDDQSRDHRSGVSRGGDNRGSDDRVGANRGRFHREERSGAASADGAKFKRKPKANKPYAQRGGDAGGDDGEAPRKRAKSFKGDKPAGATFSGPKSHSSKPHKSKRNDKPADHSSGGGKPAGKSGKSFGGKKRKSPKAA